MAKAQFHKGQRVFVRPVGTWALVEQVIPKWTRGIDEPIRVGYDCGLGREFSAEELEAPRTNGEHVGGVEGPRWRVIRARNRWNSASETEHHPHPGTYPVVVTAETNWGGWRVPAAEYDLDPEKIEKQAQIIVRAQDMMHLLLRMIEYAKQNPEDLPDDMHEMLRSAAEVLVRERDTRQSTPSGSETSVRAG